MSPFWKEGGQEIVEDRRGDDHERGGPAGGDPGGRGEAVAATGSGGADGAERAAGEAAFAALPGAWGEGADFEASWAEGEQCDSAGGAGRDSWGGAGALRGLFTDPGLGEAEGGARLWGVGGDVAQVDGRRGAVAVEEAPGDAGASEPSPAAGAGGVGADRRLAAPVVRGPGAVLVPGYVRISV